MASYRTCPNRTAPFSRRPLPFLPSRRGFTIFEIVLVLIVVLVLAAAAYPSLESMYGAYRLTAAADMVRAAWASARAHAMDEGVPYRFAIIPSAGNFRVAPDNSAYWAGSGAMPEPADPANPPLVLEDGLPSGVRFATPDQVQGGTMEVSGESSQPIGSIDPGSWTTVTLFLPDGTAQDDVQVAFSGRGGRPLLLKLRSMTGAVTLQP